MRDVRIQKVLSEQGVASRRAAEKLIEQGRVKLNGRPVSLGDKMDPRRDILSIDDQNIYINRKMEHGYYMLHKPRGYITTMKDERGRKTVAELVEDLPQKVLPVGRLDKDSEGLLFFSNDGEFINMLTHPSHGISKLYRTTVRPRATEEKIIELTNGVTLDDGTKTLPAVVRVVTDEPERTVLEISIKEGKNRQIRRMCEAVGLEVIRLRRTAVGPVKLGMLPPGKIRELKPFEVNALKGSALKSTLREEARRNNDINKTNRAKRSKPFQ